MSHSLIQRSLAFGFAAFFTLTILGGIDRLAQRDEAGAASWALKASQPARHA